MKDLDTAKENEARYIELASKALREAREVNNSLRGLLSCYRDVLPERKVRLLSEAADKLSESIIEADEAEFFL